MGAAPAAAEDGGGVMPDTLTWIKFFSRQLSEHALFMNLGLVDSDLKRRADVLHADWEAFRTSVPDAATSDLVPRAVELAAPLRGFTSEVHDRVIGGEWLGWLVPTLLEHMNRELDYFVATVRAPAPKTGLLAASDELCMWLRHNAEEAAFAAHLLDPSETVLIGQAQGFVEKFGDLLEGCGSMEHGFVGLSAKASHLFDRYLSGSGIGTPKVRSVIHPVLALHVLREVRMSVNVMSELMGREGRVEVPE